MEKRKGHTKLYSNDHDNRIYFQDLTEILEEMNGPDFYGSMGYAELCVETTLKNYYDIDINNGPVSYDPEVDYRMLLIDLAHELRMGKKMRLMSDSKILLPIINPFIVELGAKNQSTSKIRISHHNGSH